MSNYKQKKKLNIKKGCLKTIDIIAWIFVFLTLSSLILTIISTYQYLGSSIKYFEDYTTFQIGLFITMALGTVSLYDKRNRTRSLVYAIGCFVVASGMLYFIFQNVT